MNNYVNNGCLNPVFCIGNSTRIAGASANLNDVVWGQRTPVVEPPGALPGSPADTHIYGYEVYESVDEADHLVGLVPSGGELTCNPRHGDCVVPPCGAAMGNAYYEVGNSAAEGGSDGFAPIFGAVSGNGDQVIFTSPDPNTSALSACPPAEVYVRDGGAGETIDVSASQKTNGSGPGGRDSHGPQPKVYAGSAQEGGRVTAVFFTSHEELTNDANTGSEDGGTDLYVYSLASGRLTDITPDTDILDANGAEVIEFIGASSDGSLVYFTASGALAAGAVAGSDNLYVHDLASGKTTFIASGLGVRGTQIHELTFVPEISSQVAPDGKHLVFLSSQNLTSYEQEGWAEAYLYDASSRRLICVSCNPSGAPPVESARLPRRPKGGAEFDLPSATLPIPLTLSDDGSRVFFGSVDRLTPEAESHANARGELEPNVYEYTEGRVYLIASRAALLGTTPSGNDVLFETAAQLAPQDRDGTLDVYDARVDGGFPALAPQVCSGTSCQGVPAPSPIFATPPSVTFTGVGNFTPVTTVKAKPKKVKAKVKKKSGKAKKRKRKSHKSNKGGK